METRQSERQLYPLPQNDNGAASKFKAQTGGLQLWPWSRVCIVELWVLHIISLKRTFEPNLINIFQRVQEIWSEHEIQGSNSWPLTVTLTLSACLSLGSARLTEANIWPKFNENLSKGSRDMEGTRKCYRRTDEGHFYNPPSGLKIRCINCYHSEKTQKNTNWYFSYSVWFEHGTLEELTTQSSGCSVASELGLHCLLSSASCFKWVPMTCFHTGIRQIATLFQLKKSFYLEL